MPELTLNQHGEVCVHQPPSCGSHPQTFQRNVIKDSESPREISTSSPDESYAIGVFFIIFHKKAAEVFLQWLLKVRYPRSKSTGIELLALYTSNLVGILSLIYVPKTVRVIPEHSQEVTLSTTSCDHPHPQIFSTPSKKKSYQIL